MAEKPAAKKEEKEEEEEGVTFGRKKTGKADVDREHPFWDHQPMLRLSEKNIAENTYIEAPKDPVKDIRQTPLDLLKEFEWCDTDIDDPVVAKEIYDLLNQNYVEDDDNMFRFDYSIDFLRWALKPPGFRKNWHFFIDIGVRVVKTKKLVAFISAIPVIMRVYDKTMPMVEINFLCVHKKLRKHRLAPVLISEITRRVNVTNVWQAVYTAGVVLPRPVTRSRYWHRSLNPLKLVDVGFSHLGPRLTKARMTRLYRLPDAPLTPGLRPLTSADVPVCHKLLEEYLKKFDLVPLITVEEFAHWIVPRTDVIYSWVVEDAATKTVTDFVSFYSLPSTIIGNTKYSTLKAAYAYYNVATKTPLKVIMNDALILAKAAGFDVFNCLDIMENSTFLKELKFGIGDGNLQYYLYNWKCPDMPPSKLGLVLMTQFAPSFQLCFRSLTMLTNTTTERAGRRDGQRARRLAMQPSPGSRATSPNKTGGAASGPMNEEEKRFFDKYGVLPPRSRPNKPYPHGDSTGYQEPTSAALKSFIAQQKAKRRSLLLQALVLLYHDRKRQPPSTALISTLPSDLLVRCIILLKAMSTFLWDHLTEVETRMRERRSLKIAQLRTNVSDLSLIQLRFIEAPRPQGSPRSDGDASSEGSSTT